MMLNNQKKEVCYNVHITVDEKNKLILDHEVVNEHDDFRHLNELSKRGKEILDVDELKVIADAAYFSFSIVSFPRMFISSKKKMDKPSFFVIFFETLDMGSCASANSWIQLRSESVYFYLRYNL